MFEMFCCERRKYMRYIYAVSSFVMFKVTQYVFARRLLSLSLTKKFNQKEPGLSLYLRTDNHVGLIELLNSLKLEDNYLKYLKAIVYRHEKNYSKAYELVHDIDHAGLHFLKVRLLYELKDMHGLIQLSKSRIDILKYLTPLQQQTLLRYLVARNLFDEAEYMIHTTEVVHDSLSQMFEEAKGDIYYRYTWTSYRANILDVTHTNLSKNELYELISKQNKQMQSLGFVLFINEYYMNPEYTSFINEYMVPHINAEPSLLHYINPNAIYGLNFTFDDDTEEVMRIQSILNQIHQGADPDRLLGELLTLLENTLLNHQHIFTFRRILLENKININSRAFKKLLRDNRKMEAVFHYAPIYTEPAIKDDVDKVVSTVYSPRSLKRIYHVVTKQLANLDEQFTLPKHYLEYLEQNHAKVEQTVVLFKHYYNIERPEELQFFVIDKTVDKRIKVHVRISHYLFKQRRYDESLAEIESAYLVNPKHVDVLRGLIRTHHVLGNIDRRFRFVKELRAVNDMRLFKNEYELARQETKLFHMEWDIDHNFPLARDYLARDKKILFVLNKALPAVNGYTIRSNEMMKRVHSEGFNVVATTRLGWAPEHEGYKTPDTRNDEIRIHYLDQSSKYLTNQTPILDYFDAYAHALNRIIEYERPSVIHAASNFQNALPALQLGRAYSIQTVYEVRGMWHHTQSSKSKGFMDSDRFKLHETYELYCARLADRVICISESLKNYLVDQGIDSNKITVVPNGVDSKNIQPIEPDETIQEKYNLDDYIVLGFIGSITAYEGLELVLEAVKQLNEDTSVVKRFKFLVVGDGPYRAHLESYAEQLQITDDVIFVGKVPHEEIAQFYSVIDIAPFPRINDLVCQLVTPIKTYEAMSMGKRVIVSDVGALKEMVIDKKNGVYFEAENVDSLVESIREVMHLDNLGYNAREWVINFRDWKVLTDDITKQYKKEAVR